VTELKPEDVPEELVLDAVDVWHELWGKKLLDDLMRHVLAGALNKYRRALTPWDLNDD
jgi:hypothetical protein